MPPESEFITGMPGVKVRHVFEVETEIVIKGGAVFAPDTKCPRCASTRFRVKATRIRHFKHAILTKKLVRLKLRIPKLFCKACGRYFMLRVPGILPKKRSTENYRTEVFQLHQGGTPGVQLSRTHAVSGSTV